MNYNTRVLSDSIKFYLPRTEGYLEIIRHIADQYGAMYLIEFDGYFEGKFEPTKYMLVGVHVNDIKEEDLIGFADKIRIMLKQKSLAFELNNRLTDTCGRVVAIFLQVLPCFSSLCWILIIRWQQKN